MCGIFALLSRNFGARYVRDDLYKSVMKIQGRGPDATKYLDITPNVFFGFVRLSINDMSNSGMQPFMLSNSQFSNNKFAFPSLLNNNKPQLERIHDETPDSSNIMTVSSENDSSISIVSQCNGEIYNAFELADEFGLKLSSKSDCEIIPHLYQYFNYDIEKVIHSLDGVFAFTLYDKNKDILYAARDPIGVRPLFIGKDNENESIFLASESKAFINYTKNIEQIPPGSYWRSDKPNQFFKWFQLVDSDHNTIGDINGAGINRAVINGAGINGNGINGINGSRVNGNANGSVNGRVNGSVNGSAVNGGVNGGINGGVNGNINFGNIGNHKVNRENDEISTEDEALKMIRTNLIAAVKKRLMSERPIGSFLSGGLDSSLITALVNKYNPYTVNTYSIGMKTSSDLINAKIVSDHIGTNHNEYIFTAEEALNELENVIYCLESFDIITIRGSIAMYLLSKYISNNDNNDIVLYSGEGSDEITQGYLYFHNSPNCKLSCLESQRITNDLCYFDVKRVDRTVATHGLEVRVPFLDKNFIKNYFKISTNLRTPNYKNIEKYLIRKAFDTNTIKNEINNLKINFQNGNINYDEYNYKYNELNELIDLVPSNVLWRTKEGFSDGLAGNNNKTKSWYEMLQEHINNIVSDEEYNNSCYNYEQNNKVIPINKEGYYYKKLYEKHFGTELELTPYYWMPKWQESTNDPSAKGSNVYKEKLQKQMA